MPDHATKKKREKEEEEEDKKKRHTHKKLNPDRRRRIGKRNRAQVIPCNAGAAPSAPSAAQVGNGGAHEARERASCLTSWTDAPTAARVRQRRRAAGGGERRREEEEEREERGEEEEEEENQSRRVCEGKRDNEAPLWLRWIQEAVRF